MIYRIATAIVAGSLLVGTAFAQTTSPAGDRNKEETNCTTSAAATSGGETSKDSMTVGNSAVLPDAGGHANSAAPTVQSSGNKPMEVRRECPPETKSKS